MKKTLLLVIMILMLVGCGQQKKFYLDDERYEKGAITEISIDDFKEYEDDKKSFMVFVYLPSCSSCAEFREVLNEYIEDHDIEFYAVSILETDGTVLRDKVKFAPSLVLFKDGKYVDFLDAESDKDKAALTSVEGLDKWLSDHIYLSK